MKPFLRNLLIAAGATGALAGWIDTRRTLTVVAQDAEAWSPAPSRIAPPAGVLAASLMETGHFTGPAKPEPQAVADVEAERARNLKFPMILATANIDGEIAVSLKSGSGKIVTVTVGDEVDGTWIIESASLDGIVISRDGVLTEIAVFPEKSADG